MTRLRKAIASLCVVFAVPSQGQENIVAIPVAAPSDTRLLIPAGTMIELLTDTAMSSKKNVKGDLMHLKVAVPVIVDGVTAIPAGTPVIAQLTDAVARGAFGRAGKLDVTLLYAELPSGPLRVSGKLEARGKNDADDAAATAAAFLALPFIATGRSAEIPAGSEVSGRLDRDLWIERR